MNLRICGRHGRKFVHNTKNWALELCISTQKVIVILSKLVRLISIIFGGWLMGVKKIFFLVKSKNLILTCDTESESRASRKLDLSHYVLHLEGEEDLIDVMMKPDKGFIDHSIRVGRKKQPKSLIQLLEKLNPSRGFEGVQRFDSYQVPSLDSEEPLNSWALPVVTLTSIAIATSNSDFGSVKQLITSVHEGLKYIRVIEQNLDIKSDMENIRMAAETVWVGVDLHYKWLDVDLRKMALKGKSPIDTVSELSEIAKHKFMDLRKNDAVGCLRYNPSKWPIKVLAANSMYRICQTILLNTENRCSKVMLESLTAMITEIMGACLTNLQHAIEIKCHNSSIEEREENVRYAIRLLGQTERILEILSCIPPPILETEKMACINEWRALGKTKDQCRESSTPNTTSCELYLKIDL